GRRLGHHHGVAVRVLDDCWHGSYFHDRVFGQGDSPAPTLIRRPSAAVTPSGARVATHFDRIVISAPSPAAGPRRRPGSDGRSAPRAVSRRASTRRPAPG